jgi:hypothetical protein
VGWDAASISSVRLRSQLWLNFGFRAYQESGIDDAATKVIIDISLEGPST